MRIIPALLAVVLLAPAVAAQTTDTSTVPGTSVSGVVHDSIARRPLGAATVQLVAADGAARFARATESDSLGRYLFRGVPNGTYMIGFLHPTLDSLGVAPPLREVYIVQLQPARVDLAIPSAARLRVAICGSTTRADSGAVVVGTVRDPRSDAAVDGARVTGEWLELSIGLGGMSRRAQKLTARTGENGWFALCNVPRDGVMELLAVRGRDSTSRIDVLVPADGFLRADLYLNSEETVASGGAAPRGRAGNGRLTGTVVALADGRPITGAQVGIVDGPETRTNERGEWTLAGIVLGTRVLEVRAVGFYPDRRPVNVIAGGASVRVALSTLKSVLDTVRVTGRSQPDRNRHEFMIRRRSYGTGRFLTVEDIARRGAIRTSDIFRSVSGITVDLSIRMRGAFGECAPSVYLNGLSVSASSELTPDDIDNWADPDEIAAIEIYVDHVPPQFQAAMNGCGSIVIWTK